MTEILLAAEKTYATKKIQRIGKSDEVTSLQATIRYWQILLSAHKNKRDFTIQLQQIEDQLPSLNIGIIKKFKKQPQLGLAHTRTLLKQKRLDILKSKGEIAAIEYAIVAEADQTSPNNVEKGKKHIQSVRNTFRSLKILQS